MRFTLAIIVLIFFLSNALLFVRVNSLDELIHSQRLHFGARVLNYYVDAEFGRHIMGLSTDPNFYYNRAVANYYGLKAIAIEVPQ